MKRYRLRFLKDDVFVTGEDFQAEDLKDAKSVAAVIVNACSAKYDATELWECMEVVRSGSLTEAKIAAMRQTGLVDTEIALGNSAWVIRESRQLLDRLVAKEPKGK